MKTSIPPVLITFALVCVALVQKAQAVVPATGRRISRVHYCRRITKALQNLTTGSANTAVGWYSLFSNTAGSFNTAAGAGSLLFNTADANTAFGTAALLFNSTGINNTAIGAAALLNNTIAEENTATGAFALSSNTEGDFNTANGTWALFFNTIGERNTAIGDSALYFNTGRQQQYSYREYCAPQQYHRRRQHGHQTCNKRSSQQHYWHREYRYRFSSARQQY